MSRPLHRQTLMGVGLALMLIAAWAALLGYGLFVHRWSAADVLWVPLLVALICWLDAGLFIVAHDAMHGTLAPTLPRLNRALGALCMGLYAGFLIGRFDGRHMDHHRAPGTAHDPDFHLQGRRFWPWYANFMRQYTGLPEILGVATMTALFVFGLGAPFERVMLFWALPAILSSVQLFAFGTWLPHRLDQAPDGGFADHHRARSNAYGLWASLFTCFHFGYHHEHHLRPDAPWWRLPAVRRQALAGELALRPAGGSTAARAAPSAAAAGSRRSG